MWTTKHIGFTPLPKVEGEGGGGGGGGGARRGSSPPRKRVGGKRVGGTPSAREINTDTPQRTAQKQ